MKCDKWIIDQFTKPRLIFTPTPSALAGEVIMNRLFLQGLRNNKDLGHKFSIGKNTDGIS